MPKSKSSVQKVVIHRFQVEGRFPFPYAMLRDNRAYPADMDAVKALHEPFPPITRRRMIVNLESIAHETWEPDGWEAWGWDVNKHEPGEPI